MQFTDHNNGRRTEQSRDEENCSPVVTRNAVEREYADRGWKNESSEGEAQSFSKKATYQKTIADKE